MSKQITVRQLQVLDLIRESIQHRGYAPTLRELGEACGIASPNAVSGHLKALADRGLIRREARRARAITILEGRDDG